MRERNNERNECEVQHYTIIIDFLRICEMYIIIILYVLG